jgi:hypothetical protein
MYGFKEYRWSKTQVRRTTDGPILTHCKALEPVFNLKGTLEAQNRPTVSSRCMRYHLRDLLVSRVGDTRACFEVAEVWAKISRIPGYVIPGGTCACGAPFLQQMREGDPLVKLGETPFFSPLTACRKEHLRNINFDSYRRPLTTALPKSQSGLACIYFRYLSAYSLRINGPISP